MEDDRYPEWPPSRERFGADIAEGLTVRRIAERYRRPEGSRWPREVSVGAVEALAVKYRLAPPYG